MLCFVFLSANVYADIIESKEKMAIGTVEVNCTHSNFVTKGFLSKIYQKTNNTIKLFDINPQYKTGEINCSIISENIYNLKGEKLDVKIKSEKENNSPIILFLILVIICIIIYKKSRNY